MTQLEDPKYIDLLEEDKTISGQKFVCLSFVSPEKILKQKEIFMFQEYLKQFDFSKSMDKFTQFMNFVSYKYNIDFELITNDLKEFVKEEKHNLFTTTMEDDYKSFLDANEEKLEQTFNVKHKFETSTRGIKVRGSFPSQEEAELRCKMLREVDPNHDVYVGPVGVWMPFHPEAYKTGRVEYLEKELNELMGEKMKNENAAKIEFEKRVKESKSKAIQDNIEKAKISGVKLTQTINEDGDLVSIKNMNTTEDNILKDKEESDIASSDIRKELFESNNVVLDKNTDHGLGEILKNNPEIKADLEKQLKEQQLKEQEE